MAAGVPGFNAVVPTPMKPLTATAPQQRVASPSSTAPSHRVLYRGSLSFLQSESDILLEGVCFVAHFDSVSPTRSALLSSPLPLALESQRGRAALTIFSVIPTTTLDDRLDDIIDLKMYIHPESLITRAYFERLFCMDGVSLDDERTPMCVRVRLGEHDDDSDDIVLYGKVPPDGSYSNNHLGPTPRLSIHVARLLPPPNPRSAAFRPRPDDPLPRVPRFAVPKYPSIIHRSPSPPIKNPPPLKAPGTNQRVSEADRPPLRGSTSQGATGKSFRIPQRAHKRQKSSLSMVSSLHNGLMLAYDEDADVFGVSSSDHEFVAPTAWLRQRSSDGLIGGHLEVEPATVPQKYKIPRKVLTKTMEVTGEEDNLQRVNKETIKRMAVSLLTSRGLAKDHDDFKEVYQISIRGAGFALRTIMNERRIEREEAKTILQKHLDMYLSPSVPTEDGTLQSSST